MIILINNTNKSIRYVTFKMFLEKGYESTNIRDICKEVKIKASSLYFYYPSKQDLFFSIYDEIWEDKIKFLENIEERKLDISPDIKLKNIITKTIEYYTWDIVKQKFLLRYHLFPPDEITHMIRERFKQWTKKENEIILEIINECLKRKILSNKRSPDDYLREYKKFENSQYAEMILSNVKLPNAEADKLWVNFWNSIRLI